MDKSSYSAMDHIKKSIAMSGIEINDLKESLEEKRQFLINTKDLARTIVPNGLEKEYEELKNAEIMSPIITEGLFKINNKKIDNLTLTIDVMSQIDKGEVPHIEKHTTEQLETVLETVVVPTTLAALQPSLRFFSDEFYEDPSMLTELTKELENYRKQNLKNARSVGRIEAINLSENQSYIGTGFMIAQDAIATNCHVANEIASRSENGSWIIDKSKNPCVDFKEYDRSDEKTEHLITKIIKLFEDYDIAILGIEPVSREKETKAPKPLLFSEEEFNNLVESKIYVVGYPGEPSDDYFKTKYGIEKVEDVLRRVFHDIYNIKRISPGAIRGFKDDYKYERGYFGKEDIIDMKVMLHDCPTTGGSSGSPVFEIATGKVLGIHFSCEVLYMNYAFPIWKLKNEPVLKEIGVKFA